MTLQVLMLFTLAALLSRNQFALNLALFISMSMYVFGLLVIACLLFVIETDGWGERGRTRRFRRFFTRLLITVTVITLAGMGWYWSALAWIFWWITVEIFMAAFRQHWKEVDAYL
jgi:amino acid transporter